MDEQGVRLLLVEDEPGVMAALEEMMSYDKRIETIKKAETLQQALCILDHYRMDVICLDLNLPDSSGADTVETLVVHFPEIPIIVLTAQDLTSTLVDELIIAGAFAFVSKSSLFQVSLTDWVCRAHRHRQVSGMTNAR